MKAIYDWVPWFRELVAKIAEVGERGLIDRAQKVDWGAKDPALLRFGAENIDPLSFVYFLSSKNGNYAVFKSVHHIFEIDTDLPDKETPAWVFPTAMSLKATFYGKDGPKPKLFWRLFRQVQPDEPTLDDDTFRGPLEIKGLGVAMLTQAMCLVNAYCFLPIDGYTKSLIGQFPAATILKKSNARLKDTITLPDYMAIIRGAQNVFRECELYEIGRFLYEHGVWEGGLVSGESRYFHIGTRVQGDEGPDSWDEFKKGNCVFTSGQASGVLFNDSLPDGTKPYPLDQPKEGDIFLVRGGVTEGRGMGVVVSNDYAKPGGLRADSRIHVLWINKARSRLSGQTERSAMGEISKQKKATFCAFSNAKAYEPTFEILRVRFEVPDPVAFKGEEPNGPVVTHSRNQILYGPPGTGKTWNTVSRAVAIADDRAVVEVEADGRECVKARFDELRGAGQVAMATFHQNYAYEDFIEGIRPVVEDDADDGVAFELRHGVFRVLADRAADNLRNSKMSGDDSWKVEEVLRKFLEWVEETTEGEKRIPLYRSGKVELFLWGVYKGKNGEVAGVRIGGTTEQNLSWKVLLRDYPRFRKGLITSYQDIEPMKASKSPWFGQAIYAYEVLKKMGEFHDEHREDLGRERTEKHNYVLIIDEINRGNIARIFGELITLLEESRRIGGSDETKVALPYSGDEFGVPENLYIIGTMNTADRSIALLDTALRRRFEFVEMMPNADHEGVSKDAGGVDCRQLLKAMNRRIRFLLDREHQIGHTYFLGVQDIEGLGRVFQKQILPLLQEYFYDDWTKIGAVLGGSRFLEAVDSPTGLKEKGLVDPDAKAWEVLSAGNTRWGEAAAYREIYAGKAGEGTAQGADDQAERGRDADDE